MKQKGLLQRILISILVLIVVITGIIPFAGFFFGLPDMTSVASAAAIDKSASGPNGDWTQPNVTLYAADANRGNIGAEMMVRVGDIDNFGSKDWQGKDPFSGDEINAPLAYLSRDNDIVHSATDPAGTDQLMVVSSFRNKVSSLKGEWKTDDTIADGYTRTYYYYKSRTLPQVVPIDMVYNLRGIQVNTAVLQIYINDFQARKPKDNKWNKNIKYTAYLDDNAAPFISEQINALNQHGPLGQLLTFQIPESYLKLLQDGRLTLRIDDNTTTSNPYGDAMAIDFVKLLINPGDYSNVGSISGTVRDTANRPIANATVSAMGMATAQTDSSGSYQLNKVPYGLVVLEASAAGYQTERKEIPNFRSGYSQPANFTLTKISDNAYLRDLVAASDNLLPLSPSFDRETTSYTIDLDSALEKIWITPTLDDRGATMTVNGVPHASGVAKEISLQIPQTVVTIVVTAPNGSTKTYTLTIRSPFLSLTRTLEKSTVKVNEEASITYRVESKPLPIDQIRADRVALARPMAMDYKTPFVPGQVYEITKNYNPNFNGWLDNGNGKPQTLFEQGMQNVSLGDTVKIATGISGNSPHVSNALESLYQKGIKEITLPLIDVSKITTNASNRQAEVLGFATFTLRKKSSLSEIECVFANYAGTTTVNHYVTNMTYQEALPANVQWTYIDGGWVNLSPTDKGKINVRFPAVEYQQIGDQWVAPAKTYTVKVKATKSGSYILDNGAVQYQLADGSSKTGKFNSLLLFAEPAVTSITLDKSSLTMNVGDVYDRLRATVLPADADQRVSWSSSNPDIASVAGGVVTAIAPGKTIITVTSADGKIVAQCEVTVVQPVTGITVVPTSITVYVDETKQLTATLVPANASNKQVTWSSANTTIASVDGNGIVRGNKSGTTTVTVTTVDGGKSADVSVSVIPKKILVESLKLTPSSLELYEGKRGELQATISPANATNKRVIYISSNPSVATVDQNGVVTAIKAGEAIITAISDDNDNIRDTARVTVVAPATGYKLYYDQAGTIPVDKADYGIWLDKPVWVELVFPANLKKEYVIDGETRPYTGLIPVSKEGVTDIQYEETAGRKATQEIKIDREKPTVSIGDGTVDAGSKLIKNIRIKGTDSGSGIQSITVWYQYPNLPSVSLGEFRTDEKVIDIPVTGLVTVYAQAKDKLGNVSEVASRQFSLDILPPVVTKPGSGFIKQPEAGRGAIEIYANVSDSGSGVDSTKVFFTIRKITSLDSLDDLLGGRVIVEDERMESQGGDRYYGEYDVGTEAGIYQVRISAEDKVGNKTIRTEDMATDYFMVSPGYKLAQAPLVTVSSGQLEKKEAGYYISNAPVKITLQKGGNGSFFVLDQPDQSKLIAKLATVSSLVKQSLGMLENFTLKVAALEYEVENVNGGRPERQKLTQQGLTLVKDGTYKVKFYITDSYNLWGATGVTHIEEVEWTIVINSKLKKL